jgi:hypothetical protein
MRSSSETRRWPEREGFEARMTTVAAAVGAAVLAGSVYSANEQSKAARNASGAQSTAAQAGMDEQHAQFAAVQKLLSPYVTAGNGALAGQQDLLGTNGADAQAKAIAALQSSPQYTSQLTAGNNNILQNASATGNLRGGNTQAALAQFAPQLLNQTISDQYARLGGMTSLGENAAAFTGNAGLQTGQGVANLLQQQGAAQAGGYLGEGKAQAGYGNALTSAFSAYAGMGGLGGGGGGGQGGMNSGFGWKNGTGGF